MYKQHGDQTLVELEYSYVELCLRFDPRGKEKDNG